LLNGVNIGGSVDIPCGEMVTIEAIPAQGYQLVNWYINGIAWLTVDSIITIVVIDDLTITAYFEPEEYGITLLSNPEGGGYVIGGGTYANGETVTVSAISNEEYEFINWLENGVEIITDSDYTFTVTGSRTLTGNFETYDIVIQSNTSGCGVLGGGNYRPGIEITVVAVCAKSGIYEFVNWTKDGLEVSTDAEYTFITPIGNMELVANFMETHVGIETIENDGITIYPNPTDGKLTVLSEQFSVENVEIFDVFGKIHLSRVTRHASRLTINISHLPAGIYFVKITTDVGVTMRKVIKN